MIPVFEIEHGWDRDTTLMGVMYLWVFLGATAFLMRREGGRRVLPGATLAFGGFFIGMLIVALLHPVFGNPFYWTTGVVACSLIRVGLSRPAVKAAMRKPREVEST